MTKPTSDALSILKNYTEATDALYEVTRFRSPNCDFLNSSWTFKNHGHGGRWNTAGMLNILMYEGSQDETTLNWEAEGPYGVPNLPGIVTFDVWGWSREPYEHFFLDAGKEIK